MAAIQTIRKWGVALIIIIGLGLFAFVAEDFFRVFDTLFGSDKTHVGQVYGEKLSVNDYQAMIDEYTDAIKFTRGNTSPSDAELNQIKDQAWQTYVTTKLTEHEAKKLGLTVTDDELDQVLKEGSNNLLMQTPFINKATGRFDATMLKKFLEQYQQMQTKPDQVPQEYMEYYQKLYKFWNFVEKTLRASLLNDKYQALIGRSILSNPISAKLAFEGTSTKSNAVVASVPYTSIPDNAISVSNDDMKKMYDQKKEMFRQYGESRDIKFIDVQVKASAADKAALQKEMTEYAGELSKGNSASDVVRTSSSLVTYAPLPMSKKSFPNDIQSKLDSVSTGAVVGPYYNASDNTLNIVKLIATSQAPDSVQYRLINCAGASIDAAKATADSIMKAIAGGAKFENLAKNYKQNGDMQWLVSSQYEGQTIDDDNIKFIKALLDGTPNSIQRVELTQNVVLIQVNAKKGMEKKYDAAVIKRTVDFSKDTYTKAYNDFSHFVATNPTFKKMEANAAKYGYHVQEHKDMFNYEHYVANVPGTREAMKWAFDAKEGDISQLYECGNNDNLLIFTITGIHHDGYRSFDDPSVKDALRNLVLRDKKADKIMANLKGKSVMQALAMPNATKDTLNNISFDSQAFVVSTGANESALAGGISYAKPNKSYGPVKGNNGVYLFQVVSRVKTPEVYNQAKYEEKDAESFLRCVSAYSQDLYKKAKVKDNRYMFF